MSKSKGIDLFNPTIEAVGGFTSWRTIGKRAPKELGTADLMITFFYAVLPLYHRPADAVERKQLWHR